MEKLDWEDIECVATFEKGAAWVEFSVYEVVGNYEGPLGLWNKHIYEKKGATSSEDTTEDIKEAQPMVHGTIKWDTCSHVYFGDEGYIHMCGGFNWRNFREILDRVFKTAEGMLKEGHNDDMFEEYYKPLPEETTH